MNSLVSALKYSIIRCKRKGFVQINVVKYCTEAQPSAANPLRTRKPKASGNQEQAFADCRRTNTIAGDGGTGNVSLLSLWANMEAGPSGGDGGNGGHIIFQASKDVRSLHSLDPIYRGMHGEKGGTTDCTGRSGEHTLVKVPLGTIVKSETGRRAADLRLEGDMFLAARGGAGGKGNHYFLTNKNRAPLISEVGATGENKTYILELSTIAHVGLIGFPNAGKSTLLRAISRARPKVAAYPFTTLRPHIGIVNYDDYEQIVVADIPGLVAEAHLNRGLGISFLKHVERCLCFLYVIDLSQPEPWLQLETLRDELDHYSPGLSSTSSAVLGNKIDLEEARRNLPEFQRKVGMPVIPISAKVGVNLSYLLKHVRRLYDDKKLKEKLDIS